MISICFKESAATLIQGKRVRQSPALFFRMSRGKSSTIDKSLASLLRWQKYKKEVEDKIEMSRAKLRRSISRTDDRGSSMDATQTKQLQRNVEESLKYFAHEQINHGGTRIQKTSLARDKETAVNCIPVELLGLTILFGESAPANGQNPTQHWLKNETELTEVQPRKCKSWASGMI